jgi:hypothetical protein
MDASDISPQRGKSMALPSFRLCELDTFAKQFGLDRAGARRLLDRMSVPLIHIRDCAYYNEFTLERAIYVVTRPGGPGFAGPGTQRNSSLPRSFDSKLEAQMEDPALVVELTAAKNRDLPGAIRAAQTIRGKAKGK